jgi:hypothetical protein
MNRIRRALVMINIGFGVLVRPRYWLVAVRVARRMVPTRWWTHRPFLPLPTPEYVKFRLETQYGGSSPHPTLPDVLKYLQWVRQWDAAS